VKITTGFVGREQELIELFAATFTASEGPDEGALIGEFDLPPGTGHLA
jgi:putative acetyltransferase